MGGKFTRISASAYMERQNARRPMWQTGVGRSDVYEETKRQPN